MHDDDRYPIVVAWSEEDRVWVADVTDLKYCTAHGDTPEEALREAVIARTLWLRAAREEGIALPAPTVPDVLARTG